MLDQKPEETRSRFDGGEFKYLALKDQQLQRLLPEIQTAVQTGALVPIPAIKPSRLAILMNPEAFSLRTPTYLKAGVLKPRNEWDFKKIYHQGLATAKREELAQAFGMSLEQLEAMYPIYKLLGRRRNNRAARQRQLDPDLLWQVVRWERSAGGQFGREHRALREQLGLSREEAAKSYGIQASFRLQFSVTAATIARIEDEGRFPVSATAQAIRNAFDMSEDDFELMLRRAVNDPAVRTLDLERLAPLGDFLSWFEEQGPSGWPSEQQAESDFWDWADSPPEEGASLNEWAAFKEEPNIINRANEGIPETYALPQTPSHIGDIVRIANAMRPASSIELRVVKNKVFAVERRIGR